MDKWLLCALASAVLMVIIFWGNLGGEKPSVQEAAQISQASELGNVSENLTNATGSVSNLSVTGNASTIPLNSSES